VNVKTDENSHCAVIVGGGFAGLYAARRLGGAAVSVTLIDRRNFHLFQPLLYQVATGGLSPGDISAPLRSVLKAHANVRVVQATVTDVNTDERKVITDAGEFPYDSLMVGTGVRHFYFGNDDWECDAPGLKTVEDAVEIRRRILRAFEMAERENDEAERRRLLTFVIIGGGPTGVELAGALAELSRATLRDEFRAIDPSEATIHLLEGADRILPPFPEKLSRRAQRTLERLGVTVTTGAMVSSVEPGAVEFGERRIEARTILWAAGVRASPLGEVVASRTGAETDKAGRVVVDRGLNVPGHPEIFVVGDLAAAVDEGGKALPGVAPVAIQQGDYVARRILGTKGRDEPFRYRDKGNLAVIGRNAAVASFGRVGFGGFFAWMAWVFVHIWYLIDYDNKVLVMVQWAMNYVTRKRGARLITNEPPPEES
jgi:NADH dehydrogenase